MMYTENLINIVGIRKDAGKTCFVAGGDVEQRIENEMEG